MLLCSGLCRSSLPLACVVTRHLATIGPRLLQVPLPDVYQRHILQPVPVSQAVAAGIALPEGMDLIWADCNVVYIAVF